MATNLWVKLGIIDKDIDNGLKQAENKFKRFGDRIGGLGSKMTQAFSLPLGIVGGMAVKTAADIETAEIAFTTLLGSAEAAKDKMAELKEFARTTPFQFPELVDATRRMLALGFTAKSVTPSLRVIGDAVSALGVGKEGLDNIILALGQMQNKGKVAAEEMTRQLGQYIPAWQYLAKKLGITVSEAMDQASQGMIDGATGVRAILEGLANDPQFAGGMKKQAESLAGVWSNFKDTLTFTLADIGGLIVKTFDLKDKLMGFTEGLKRFADWFAALDPGFRKFLVNTLAITVAMGPLLIIIGKMATGLSAVIGLFRLLAVSVPLTLLKKALADIVIYIGGAVTGAWSWSAAMGALATTFGPFLVGGAIIAGLAIIIAMFVEAGRQAKVMALDMKNATDMAQIQESIKLNQEKLNILQRERIADRKLLSEPQTPANMEAQKMARLRTTGQEGERRRLLELEYGTQIQAGQERLKQLSGEFASASTDFSKEWADLLATLDETGNPNANPADSKKTVSDAQEALAQSLREIAEKEKLNLPGYDATRERMQALQRAIDDSITATDADTDTSQVAIGAMVTAFKNLQTQVDARTQAEKEAAEAARLRAEQEQLANDAMEAQYAEWREMWDKFNIQTDTDEPKYEFNDYLNETADLLQGVQGPLKEFADTILSIINQIQSIDFKALTKEGFDANSSGALGAVGGFLGMFSAISGIIGLVATLIEQLTGSADAQKKAAEEWQKFLQEASSSELFGEKSQMEEDLEELQKARAELAKQWWNPARNEMLKVMDAQIADLKKRIKEDVDVLKKMLGITETDLSNALKGAFDAANATEFLTKFKQSFNDIIREALINNFVSEQVLGPISDAIAAAFNPTSQGGASVTKAEFEALKSLWNQVGEQGEGLFAVFKKLGIGVEGVTNATNAATQAMLNVPEGLKVARYAYDAANALTITGPVIVPGSSTPTQSTATPTSGGSVQPGGGMGQAIIQIYLNGRAITDDVKIWLERDNILFNGSLVPPAPTYV
jgi:tape measure domain-containing protein